MSNLIDTLINLDTDHYLSLYKDVQVATKNLSDVDRKLWILTHFVKHGYSEHRKYQLKTTQINQIKNRSASETKRPKPPSVRSEQKPRVSPKNDKEDSSDGEQDVQELIKKFRQKHGKEPGGVRDKPIVDNPPSKIRPNDDPRIKKNFFWEISR